MPADKAASPGGGSGAAGTVAPLRTFVEEARANAARFEAKLDAALQKLDEILAQLASQDRKLDHITDQLARLQEPSPGPKAYRALRAGIASHAAVECQTRISSSVQERSPAQLR